MAANNDFYLKFDSNAAPWAKALEAELSPAYAAVKRLQDMLASVDATAAKVGGGGAFAKAAEQDSAAGRGTGGGGGISADVLKRDMELASQAVSGVVEGLADTITSLRSVKEELRGIPSQVRTAVQGSVTSLTKTLERNIEQATGNGRVQNPLTGRLQAGGGVQLGSSEAKAWTEVRTALVAQAGGKAQVPQLLQAMARNQVPGVSSLAGVSRSSIDKANFDRVISAIHEQTKLLQNALQHVQVAGPARQEDAAVNTVTTTEARRGTAPAVAQIAEDASPEALKALEARAKVIDEKIAQVVNILGVAADDDMKTLLDGLKTEAAQVRAQVRAKDREVRGVSQSQQKAEARADYAARQKARPAIGEEDLTLLRSAAAPDFLTKIGRGRDQYSVADLRRMAASITNLGSPVEYSTRTKQAELAERVHAGAQSVLSANPEGFNVERMTKISDSLVQFLGEITRVDAALVQLDRNLLRADALGGGNSPFRGRPERGAGILGNEVPSPLTRAGTPEEVDAARERLKRNPLGSINTPEVQALQADLEKATVAFSAARQEFLTAHEAFTKNLNKTAEDEAHVNRLGAQADALNHQRTALQEQLRAARSGPTPELATVLPHITNPEFNPYDKGLGSQIQPGNTEEERALAKAYQSRLTDARQTTTVLDKMGQEWLKLREAMTDTGGFLSRALARQGGPHEKPTDEAEIPVARQRFQNLVAQMRHLEAGGDNPELQALTPGTLKNIFTHPDFPLASYGRTEERKAYEARREAALGGPTLSDRRLAQESLATTTVGLTTAPGLKALLKALPGLAASTQGKEVKLRADEQVRNPLTNQESTDLNTAFRQASRAQQNVGFLRVNKGLGVLSEEDASKLEKAEADAERLINKYFNVLERLFHGIAPPLQSYLGRQPINPESQGDESRRALARDQAEAARTKRIPTNWTGRPLDEQEYLGGLSKQYAKDRKTLAKKITDAQQAEAVAEEAYEQESSRRLSELSDAERKQLAAARKAQKAAERAANRADKAAFAEVPENKAQRRVDKKKLGGFTLDDLGYQAHLGYGDSAYKRTVTGDILPFGPLPQGVERSPLRPGYSTSLQDEAEVASRRAAEARRATSEILAPQSGAGLESARRTRAQLEQDQKRLAQNTETVSTRLKGLQAAIKTVTELAAGGATRKAIAEQTGLKPSFIKGVLGPARPASAASSDTRQVATASLDELKVQRDALRGQRQTRAEIKQLIKEGGDEKVVADARALRKRYSDLKKAIAEAEKVAEGAGGGAGASGGAGAPPAGGRRGGGGLGGGSSNELLKQILDRLTQVHTTIKNGIKVRPAESTTRTARPPDTTLGDLTARTTLEQAGQSPEQAFAEIAAQRAKQQAAAGTRTTTSTRTVGSTTISAKDAASIRSQIRDQQRLAEATALVSDAVTTEVGELRALYEAAEKAATAEAQLAAQTALAAKQVEVFSRIDSELRAKGLNAQGRTDAGKALLRSAGPVSGTEFDGIARSVRQSKAFSEAGNEAGNSLGSQMGLHAEEGFAGVFGKSGFFKRVIASTGTFLVRNFTAGFVFGLTNALQEVIDQAIKTESTFVRVSSALEATGKDIGNIRGDLQQVSRDYGVQLSDVYDTAAGLANLFANSKDLAAGVRVVAQLQLISDGALNAQEAMGVLASTLSAFEKQPGDDISAKVLPGGLEGVQHVADVLTTIQNQLNVNVEHTAEGVAALSGAAKAMKLSFEETAVFVAQISKQTNQTGAAAGEQFGRILEGLQTGRGRDALQKAIGAQATIPLAQGDYGKVLENLIRAWGKGANEVGHLTDAQKRNLVTQIAGARNARAFYALMNNGTDTLNTLTRAQYSNGTANDRATKLMATLNGQLLKFRANINNLGAGLVRTGLLNFLGLVLVSTNSVLGAVNSLLSEFNKIADSNQVLKWMRDLITLLVGAGLAIKVLQYGWSGLKGAIKGTEVGRSAAAEVATMNAARAERAVAGPARPAFSTYGRPGVAGAEGYAYGSGFRAPVLRGTGFAADRTLGVALDGTARGLTGLGTRLTDADRQVGAFGRGIGRVSGFLGRVTTPVASGTRGFFQGLGGGLGGRSAQFASRAEQAAQAAAEARALEDAQRQYQRTPVADRAGLEGRLTNAGYSEQQLGRIRGTEDLGRTATRLEGVSSRAERASSAFGKLDSTLGRLNATGALTDVAMVGLTLLIAAIADSAQHSAQVAKTYDADYKARYGKDAGKSDSDKAKTFYGESYQDSQKNLEDMQNSSLFSKGVQAIGSRFHNGFRGLVDERYAYARQFGTTYNGSQLYGYDDASKLLGQQNNALKDAANAPGATSDSLLATQKEYAAKIKAAAEKIEKDGSLSKAQKEAALGALEYVGQAGSDQVDELDAVLGAVGAQLTLTTDQVARLQDALTTSASTGGLQGIGSIDLAPIGQDLIKQIGAGQGSEIQKTVRSLFDGTTGTAGAAIKTSNLIQDQVKNLYIDLQTQINQGADQATIDQTRQQLLGAVQQLKSSQDTAIQTIVDNGQALSTLFTNQGNDEQGARAMARALDRADRFYRKQTQDQRQLIQLFRRNQKSLLHHAAEIDPELGPVTVAPPQARQGRALRAQDRAQQQRMATAVGAAVQNEITRETAALRVKDAKTKNPQAKAFIERKIAQITLDILNRVNEGLPIPGVTADAAEHYGNAAVSQDQLNAAQVEAAQQNLAYQQSQHDGALQAAQSAADIKNAQAGISEAYASARGDAVAAARAQVQMAKIALALAHQQEAIATTPQELAAARVAVLQAQAQLIGANAAVSQAQEDLVQSRYQVAIAMAEAAGNSVLAARRTLAAARQALAAALKKAGGKDTAEVNQARIQAIQAEAALRDAKLQDQLDTIDFNLQMGKITQAAAIKALRQILATQDLTKAQRRQLLLQIKGMTDELDNSQFNFGNIRLPTPYQVRRFIAGQKQQINDTLGATVNAGIGEQIGGGPRRSEVSTTTNTTTIYVDGADTGKVKKIIQEVVGGSASTRTRTTGARRRGR